MFDSKGYICLLSVSNIVGMTVKCLFTIMERGYTLVGCLVRVKAGDTEVPQYLQTRGALELILKLKIDFLEK